MKKLTLATVCLFGFSLPLLAQEAQPAGEVPANYNETAEAPVISGAVISAGALFAAAIAAVASQSDGSATSDFAVTHNPSN